MEVTTPKAVALSRFPKKPAAGLRSPSTHKRMGSNHSTRANDREHAFQRFFDPALFNKLDALTLAVHVP